MPDSDAPPPAGPQACAAIASIMIGHFATRLEVEASKHGGLLPAETIRTLAETFLAAEAERFDPVLQRSWDSCSRAREQWQWENARRQPFDRLLVKPFADLFPPRQGDDGGTGVLSRRLLPGFHLAVNKMIGPALYEQCQRKSQAILARHRRGNGSHDWPAIHADGETQALLTDVLVVMAHAFGNFSRRRDWFITVINSNLAAPVAGAVDAHWQLSEHGFNELMRALFDDLGQRLRHEGAGALRARYGDHTVETLAAFFRHLDG